MANKYKGWIHVEKIDEVNNTYEECGSPFDMGEFETEDEACDYADKLSRSMEDTNELMAAAKDVIDTCEDGDVGRAIYRLEMALKNMEVK